MKSIVVVLFVTFVMSGCVNIEKPDEVRFTTNVKISEYNEISSDYMYKPTFGSIQSYSDFTSYTISAERYGNGKLWVSVFDRNIDNYKYAIDKYLKWHDIAIIDKDLITKEITRWTYKESPSTYTKITFHSGNEMKHFFVIDTCLPDPFGENCINMANFDYANVLELSKEIDMFSSGELLKDKKISDSKYN